MSEPTTAPGRAERYFLVDTETNKFTAVWPRNDDDLLRELHVQSARNLYPVGRLRIMSDEEYERATATGGGAGAEES